MAMITKDWLTLAISFLSFAVAMIALAFSLVHFAVDKKLEGRRFVTTQLWDKMTSLSELDPKQPIEADARNALNTLLAVASCWEANIVDKEMVTVVFGELYVHFYDVLHAMTDPLPGRSESAYSMLSSNQLIGKVHEQVVGRQRARAKFA